MAVTRERFEQGMTYDEYRAQMTRNKERFEENERRFKPKPEDVEAFRRLPDPLNVLVLAEDWCGDVIANLPVLGNLAKASGKLNLRVFLRDQNEDLMNQYLNQGQFKSIPTYVFFDRNMRELGVWIERPASVTQERLRRRGELFRQHPEWGDPNAPIDQLPEATRTQIQGALNAMRDEMFDYSNAEVVRELRAIVEGAAAHA